MGGWLVGVDFLDYPDGGKLVGNTNEMWKRRETLHDLKHTFYLIES